VLPPDAITTVLYADPTVPPGSAMVVIARLLAGLELPVLPLPVLPLPVPELPVLPLPVPELPVLPQPASSAVAPKIRPHFSFPMV
jgi:hypothetical protein